jgi:formylglycine-generating enzyme
MPHIVRFWRNSWVRAGLGLAVLALSALGVIRLALQQRSAPDRCPEGMLDVGPRCCGASQSFENGVCRGRATRCSSAQATNESGQCVARSGSVSLAAGELFIGAADWDGESGGERFPRTHVASFRIDATEVTRDRYRGSATSHASTEPGLPVTNVTPEAAEAFCLRQRGRLPTAAEWVWAAAGAGARRYAWGNAGLVCRRAVFGLERGPCGNGGGPELVGSRPDGATPEGVLDLAGNVAEWTREPDGSFAARGGSFRSTSAAELKSWAVASGREKALHIGFRCAYPP